MPPIVGAVVAKGTIHELATTHGRGSRRVTARLSVRANDIVGGVHTTRGGAMVRPMLQLLSQREK